MAVTSDGQSIYTASELSTVVSAYNRAEGEGAEFRIRRYAPNGTLQWSTSYPLYAREGVSPNDVWGNILLSVGPASDLYVLTDVHEGVVAVTQGPFPGLVLTKISPSNDPRWSVQLPTTDRLLAMTASRQDGVFISVVTSYPYSEELRCSPSQGAIHRIGADGTYLWRASLGEPQCGNYHVAATTLAAQPDGGVAFGGSFLERFQVGAEVYTTSMPESPVLGVLNARGEWSWVKTLPSVHGRITSVGSSAKGTVVAAGTIDRGSLSWGKDVVGAVPSFVLVAEASGAPRWAKSLGRSENPVIAVEPAGRLVVAGLSRDYTQGGGDPLRNPQLFVRRFNLEGKQLWNRFFSRSGGPSDLFTDEFIAAAPSGEGNGNTLLFGQFSHTQDFGRGPIAPSGTDTILLKVGPGPEF